MPIEVRITTPGGNANAAPARVTRIVQLTQGHQVFSLQSDVEPASVEFDPEAWVFGKRMLAKK